MRFPSGLQTAFASVLSAVVIARVAPLVVSRSQRWVTELFFSKLYSLTPKTRREPSGERSGDSGRLMAHKSSAVMTRLAGSAAKPGTADSSRNKMANSQVAAEERMKNA